MKTSPQGIAFITLMEGNVLTAYQDSVGVWTIGVGHTSAAGAPIVKKGMRITKDESAAILARDLAKFEKRVNDTLGDVPQHVFDGAVSFDFNTGRITTATWAKLYKLGRLPDAEAGLKQWTKASGKVLKGLVTRRNAEADLIFRGKYPKGLVVPAPVDPAPIPAPVPVPPPPDDPGPDPDPVFYPSPAPSGGVSASTGAAAVIVGGGLTTAAAAIDRWQVWLGLGVCVAFAAFIAFIVFRNQKD